MQDTLNHDPARGPYLGDDEPTIVRHRPAAVLQPTPEEVWRAALQDPTLIIAAVTAVLAFALSVGSGTVGFLLGFIVG